MNGQIPSQVTSVIDQFKIIDVTDTVGGGTMPNSELPGLALELKTDSPEQLHAALRASPLPIVTRIQEMPYLFT